MAEIVRLTEQDWPVARAIRLRALAADPSAFGSTLARELSFTEADWRDRLRSGGWFVAQADGSPAGTAPVGLVTVRDLVDETADVEINSMWVGPAARGQRIGAALLDAALAAAASAGARTVRLWVTDGNDAARQLYVRRGFVPTGRTDPLPSYPHLIAAEYLLDVG